MVKENSLLSTPWHAGRRLYVSYTFSSAQLGSMGGSSTLEELLPCPRARGTGVTGRSRHRRSRSIPTSIHIPNVKRRLASDMGSTNCRCAAHLPFD